MRKLCIYSMLAVLVIITGWGIIWRPALWLFVFFCPVFVLAVHDLFQKKHTLLRNYPILGRLRFVMEDLRPKIYQYFIESDTNGTPFNRQNRSVIYQRAKMVNDTR